LKAATRGVQFSGSPYLRSYLETRHSPTCVTVPFGSSKSSDTRVLTENLRKNLVPRVSPFRSSEPSGIDRLPATSYKWSTVSMGLVPFSEVNCHLGGISQIFLIPRHLTPYA